MLIKIFDKKAFCKTGYNKTTITKTATKKIDALIIYNYLVIAPYTKDYITYLGNSININCLVVDIISCERQIVNILCNLYLENNITHIYKGILTCQ